MIKRGKIQLDFSLCMTIEMVLVAFIVFFTIIGQSSLISMCVSASFLLLFGYTALRIFQKKFDLIVILLIVFAVVNVLLNGLLSRDAQLGFNYFKKVLMFSAFILMLYYAKADKVSDETYQMLKHIPIWMALLLVCSFFLGNKATYGGGITLGFTNPNFTGMWLLHLLIYVFLFMLQLSHQKWQRIFAVALMAVIIWLMMGTKARSSLVGLVIFFLLCYVGKVKKNQKIYKPWMIGLIVVSPIILVALYQYLLESQWFLKIFSFMVSEGKELDARLKVWNPAIEILKNNIWFGDYCGISNGTGSSQLHNTHLDVWCSYGLIPFLLFVYFLFQEGKKTVNSASSYYNHCAISGYFSIIITGSFEAAIVAGAMGMNILTIGLILLANDKEELRR